MCAAKQLLGILDVVQEHRTLSPAELSLKKDLKFKFLGLAAVEKLRCKQSSRLSSIRAAEANLKVFFLQAKGRKRKNFISQLEEDGRVLRAHRDKEECLFTRFSEQFGQPTHRDMTLDWDAIGLPSLDLQHLEEEFTEEEIFAVIQDLKS
jgi:hypothetical protein